MTDETTNPTPGQPLTMNLLAAHVSIDAPHYKQSRFYNFPNNFDKLFSTPVSHADNYPRHLSALSPAAYFVDLIRLLETHIPNNNLKDRRPDLWELPLDQEHTDDLVPFLEIVNNVLATQLTNDATPNQAGLTEQQKMQSRRKRARDLLATVMYPFDMPVLMPLLEIRAYLEHFGIKLAEVYEIFQLRDDAWVAETLGLSQLEFKTLSTSPPTLPVAYGLPEDKLNTLHDVSTLLQQTGLTPNELAELMRVTGLSLEPGVEHQRIEPLENSAWDYLNRIIRVSKRLGWSFSDLAVALPSIRSRTIPTAPDDLTKGKTAEVKESWCEVDLEVSALLSSIVISNSTDRNEYSVFVSDTPFQGGDTIDRLKKRAKTWWKSAASTNPTTTIAVGEVNGRYVRVFSTGTYDFAGSTPQVMGWINGGGPSPRQALHKLARIKTLCEKYELPVDVLCSFIQDMNTAPGFGAPGTEATKSLFDRVFNTPPFYHSDEISKAEHPEGISKAAYHPNGPYYPHSEMQPLPWNSLSQEQGDQGIRSSLRAALKIGNDDLQAIVDHLCSEGAENRLDPKNITLDVSTLTRFYRQSKLAQVLGMQVQEYLMLLTLLTSNKKGGSEQQLTSPEVSSLDDLRKVGYWADWLKEAGLSVYQLGYLTTGELSAEASRRFDAGPTKEQLSPLMPPLEPWFIQPQSFTQGTISSETAAGVFKALIDATLIDPCGLRSTIVTPDLAKLLAGLKLSAGDLTAITDVLNRQPSLTPWIIRPQSFAQATISSERAVAVYQALIDAKLIDPCGLRSAIVTPDLAKPLAGFKLSAGDLRAIAEVLNRQPVPRTPWIIRPQSFALGKISSETAAGVYQALIDAKLIDPCGLRSANVTPDLAKSLAGLKLAAGDLSAIADVLNRHPDPQAQLTVKQLAEAFHQDSRFVTGALDYLNLNQRSVADVISETGVQDLALLLYLAKALDLSADVFELLLKNPSLFNSSKSGSKTRFTLEALRSVHAFAEIVKAFEKQGPGKDGIASDVAALALQWTIGKKRMDSATLSKLSGWEQSQAEALAGYLEEVSATRISKKAVDVNRPVRRLTAMNRCFDLAAKLGVDIQMLIQLCGLSWEKDPNAIDSYSAAAHSLLAAIKSKYTTDEWEKVFGPIRDRLNERERDALATLTLLGLPNTDPKKKFDSLQDLSGFLLIDVEMGGCTKASYILEAISCLQTYIERWRMHLEDGINLPPSQPATDSSTTTTTAEPTNESTAIPDSLWSWMGHYRIWEANRKVFFYPENYIEPSQRQNATPLFRELQSELLQGDVTDEAVTDAYINYFDKLDELASLQIVDAHVATVVNPKTDDSEETLFIIGRTSSEPPVFFVRNAVLDESKQEYRGWTPWEKIDLTIPVQEVTALYASNRLYIFWIETKEKKEGTSEPGKKKITREATVKYSYQKVSGRWLQAQVLDQSIRAELADDTAEARHQARHDDLTLSVPSDNQTTIVVQDWSIRQYQTKKFESAPIKRIPGTADFKFQMFLAASSVPLSGGTDQQTHDLQSGAIVNSIEFTIPGFAYEVILYDASPAEPMAHHFSSHGERIDTGGIRSQHMTVIGAFPTMMGPNVTVTVRGLSLGNTIALLISSNGDDFLVRAISPDPSPVPGYTCQCLTTQAVHRLRQDLMTGSLDKLLSWSPQRDCQKQPTSPQVPPQFLINQSLKPDPEPRLDFDAGDPYAIYYREIFFHIPFLIADTLNKNQQFEHARKWYHYILDPTKPLDNSTDENGMWRFLPFRGHTIDKLKKALDDEAYHDELAEDAFDPDAIAQTRPGAYEKAVAMKYLDNLLGWADLLFTQDGWEAINQAALLYVQALNLLGPKPNPQRLALPPAVVPRVSIGKSKDIPGHHLALKDFTPSARSKYVEPFDDAPDFFCLPENDEFAGYWDRTQDCLYKIRHCMNIAGVVRQLALFEAPIDPRQLILGQAAGQGTDGLAAVTVPHYRFSVMLQQAKNLTATVIQLGSALLSALEKKDGEDLNLLRSTQEQAILNLMRSIKEKQIEDGAKHLESLGHSLDGAKYRQEHYSGLIDGGYNDAEKANLSLDAAALALQVSAAPLKGISIGGHLIPTIFGLADGGMKPGDALMVAGQLVESAAAASQQGAAMAATIAQFQRRGEDWELQQNLATYDVQQIQAELDAATIRQAIMERDLEIHDQSTQQAQARDDFYRRKFGTSDLYQWMAGRLSTVYFQTYKLALDVARSAEKAYQYERNTDATMITPGYWDSLKKGLLAGEGLMLALSQIEKAYMDDHSREFEIEKTISLFQRDNNLVSDLKTKGTCTIILDEKLFKEDFPNHYCRKIKSIAITIPAVVGPYQNIHATLKQTSNRVLLKPDKAGQNFLLGTANAPTPPADIVRSDWRSQQQIAISRGVDDSGMFQLDFRDERYLPFEGTGAVSEWELRMPKNNNNVDLINSISDVIIHLRYTALDGSDGFK